MSKAIVTREEFIASVMKADPAVTREIAERLADHDLPKGRCAEHGGRSLAACLHGYQPGEGRAVIHQMSMSAVATRCPQCNGERELTGIPGLEVTCCFCGATTSADEYALNCTCTPTGTLFTGTKAGCARNKIHHERLAAAEREHEIAMRFSPEHAQYCAGPHGHSYSLVHNFGEGPCTHVDCGGPTGTVRGYQCAECGHYFPRTRVVMGADNEPRCRSGMGHEYTPRQHVVGAEVQPKGNQVSYTPRQLREAENEWLYGNSPGGLRRRVAEDLAAEFGTDVSEWEV
jgi:hypothetical protein